MGDAPRPPAPPACHPGMGYYCYPFSPYMSMYPPFPPPPAPSAPPPPGNQVALKTAALPAASPSAPPPPGLFMGQFMIPQPPPGPLAPPPPARRIATLTHSEEAVSVPTQIKFVACHHCSVCGHARSHAFHKEHPLIPGVITPSTPCRKCAKKAAAKEPVETRTIEISDRRTGTSQPRSRSRSRTRIIVEYSDRYHEPQKPASPKPEPPKQAPAPPPPPHDYWDYYYYKDLHYRHVMPPPPPTATTAPPPAPTPTPAPKPSSPHSPRETRIIYRRYESPHPQPKPASALAPVPPKPTPPPPAPVTPSPRSPIREYETYRFEHSRSPSRYRYHNSHPLPPPPKPTEHSRGRSSVQEYDRYSFRHTRSPSIVSRRYYSPPPKVRFEQSPSSQSSRARHVARFDGGRDTSDSYTRETVRPGCNDSGYGAYRSYHSQAASPPPSPPFGEGGITRDELGPWFQQNPEPYRNIAYSERGVDGSTVQPWWDKADDSVTSVNGEHRTYVDVRDGITRDVQGRPQRELILEETIKLPEASRRRRKSKRP